MANLKRKFKLFRDPES